MKSYISNVEYNNNYFFERATVGYIDTNSSIVIVEYDINFKNKPYFKYCKNTYEHYYDEFIRISFKELKYYIYARDNIWNINKNDRKILVEFFKSKSKERAFETNWELSLWLWNYECGFVEKRYGWDRMYPRACIHPSILENIPEFLPMNTKMPNYNKLNNIRR